LERGNEISISVVPTAFLGVVSQVGPALCLAGLANLLGLAFFGTHNSPELPDAGCFLELPLAAAEAAVASLAFALRVALCFSSITHSIASRSLRRALGFLRSMECVMLYWFTQEEGIEFNMILARLASLNGTFIFLVPATAINESKTTGR
jgi:hypothetical protein